MGGSKMEIKTKVSTGASSRKQKVLMALLFAGVILVPVLLQGFQSMSFFVRVLGIIGLTVLCVLLYAVSIDMFAGYPQVHSELLNLLGVALISTDPAARKPLVARATRAGC